MDTPEASIREIATEADFATARGGNGGFFVVTDRSTPTRIHAASCYTVALPSFRKKVIENQRKRGRYFFSDVTDAVRARFPKGRPCGLCRPFASAPRPATPPSPPASVPPASSNPTLRR